MKNARILTIFALAVVLCSTAAFAKAKGPYHNLNLTPDQRTQIRQIHQEQHAQMQELAKKQLTRQEFRQQSMAIRHSSGEKVSSILTPDQRAKFEANRKNSQMKRGGHRKSQAQQV